ncbi:N-acetylmuramoyl-L-alanine amidase family protein [Terriglobus tenax]|uniref:N-acetylmuramoyl-L-alanine amidase family protein n=1 Tax=Terriglobus tenax TaxID=1111115 RepID=UPI0021DF87E8|nr:N-acetylmuramoyl-L-alanine amidase [Terriglobus tenax]
MPWTKTVLFAAAALAVTLPAARAQTATQQPVILLDPGHGGPDTGAMLTGKLSESEVTVALANRLRALLLVRGFKVVMTHTTPTDATDLNTDRRAEAANRSGAIACLTLHATGSSNGVHLFTSALPETEPALQASRPVPWNEAQSAWVTRSLRLASELQAAVARSHTPVTSSRTYLAQLDSMTCPAVAVELGPLDDLTAQDATYQQRVAEAIAGALLFWRGHPNAVTSAGATR